MKRTITLLVLLLTFSVLYVHAQSWTSLDNGLGISGESVKAIAVDPNGNIYAGGTFTGAINYIAKWPFNGNAWEALGTGVNGPVYAIAVKTSSDIYIGGAFSTAGGISVNNIARWSGSAWSDVGGGFNGTVKCLFIENSLAAPVFAGGEFVQAGSNSMNHISKWLNNTWNALGNGQGAIVNSIVEHNGLLYAGSENLVDPVQKFDGTTWSAVSGISGGKVYALASYNNNLYAGGEFSTPTRAAAKYDGTAWQTIQTTFGTQDKIYAMYSRAGVLYLGGKFSNLGVGSQASFAARKTTTNNPIQSITASTSTLDDEVYAIGNQNGKVIVGGKFVTQNHIAITNVTIGIDELNNLVLSKKFFPNPVQGQATLTITTTAKLLNPELKIYDVQSRLVTTLKTDQTGHGNEITYSFNCSAFPKGNYYYILSDDGKNILSDPFIVE